MIYNIITIGHSVFEKDYRKARIIYKEMLIQYRCGKMLSISWDNTRDMKIEKELCSFNKHRLVN